jgi:signal transduction histidine kinase
MPAKRKSRSSSATSRAQRLQKENAALRKTVRALMDRVERAVDNQGTPFSWFQAAAKLEETVRMRTRELELLNDRLKRELQSRREIELALKQAKQQAELANQSKTRFLAAASHDLRQPLNSALLFLESINDEALAETDHNLVRRSRLALAALNNLLGTLLDVARLDAGDIEANVVDFPMAALLERLGPEFQAVARAAGIRLRFRPSDAWIRTDAHLLETVLRNLISNAIRYTPRGGVLIGCRRREQGLMICVYDTGVGIERAHLEAIFDAYYQVPSEARRSNAGIGLGLSIVSRIGNLLSFERVVRSEPGKGSLFAVVVPYGSPGEETPEKTMQDRWQTATTGVRRSRPALVVVIDDNEDALAGMSAVLEKWGCRAVTATAATDAVVQLISADLEPDLIVSDYHLADGIKGDEAIAEVQRELDRRSAAAIMTSDPDPTLRKSLQERGFIVLDKPLNLAKLRAMIDRVSA